MLTHSNRRRFTQWVPGSDVLVAQGRGVLCIWYNPDAPDRVTSVPIKGDIETIESAAGRTEVHPRRNTGYWPQPPLNISL